MPIVYNSSINLALADLNSGKTVKINKINIYIYEEAQNDEDHQKVIQKNKPLVGKINS